MDQSVTRKSWLLLIVLGLIWGSTFMIIELALDGVTPFWLAAARISIAAVITNIIWFFSEKRLFQTQSKDWPNLVFSGVLATAAPFIALSWGQQYVTSAFAGISMASVALLVLPLSYLFVASEKITTTTVLGIFCGFFGVFILLGPEVFMASNDNREIYGRLACLFATFCYATSAILTRRLPPIDPIGLAAVSLTSGAIFVIPAAYLIEGAPPLVSKQTLFYLFILGIFPTAAATFLRIIIIRTAGPVFMTLTNFQVPVWSVFFSILILNEPFKVSMLLALAFILSGLLINQTSEIKKIMKTKLRTNNL
jgi:drug/metabolite transporter (DMT)-like permease